MSQPPCLGDCCIALCHRLIRIAEIEKHNPQKRLRVYLWVVSGVIGQRAVGDRIVERKHFFEMRAARYKPARKQQVVTGGIMAENEAS